MSLHVKEDFLQLDYIQDHTIYDEKRYFEEESGEPFDKHSAKQMLLMMNRVAYDLRLDEYSMKKLEIVLREELPFFAVNRRLVLNWINENFLF
ncbi:hypothetical protein [Sulfurospirillum oryzae]|uniref:hypothetical protein n=1 Tax=Sulfurospirillum oryzae TaxID=2976535 RepID=UPI0021E719F0|nr:hypothetical protein [Sulfurospirillum oryzae]